MQRIVGLVIRDVPHRGGFYRDAVGVEAPDDGEAMRIAEADYVARYPHGKVRAYDCRPPRVDEWDSLHIVTGKPDVVVTQVDRPKLGLKPRVA